MRVLLALVLVLAAAPLSAQTLVPGLVSWTHERTADLTGYRVRVDSQPAIDLGLPAENASPLALAPGVHSLTVEACYGATCLPATAISVNVVDPNAPTIAALSPASGTRIAAADAMTTGIVVRGTVANVTRVELHWTSGPYLSVLPCDSMPSPHSCSRSGDTYTYTIRLGGPWTGTRSWFLKAYWPGGVTTSPSRTVVVY